VSSVGAEQRSRASETNLLDKVASSDIDQDVLRVLYPPRDVEGASQRDEDLFVCDRKEGRCASARMETVSSSVETAASSTIVQ
jgi:hypothetical protein